MQTPSVNKMWLGTDLYSGSFGKEYAYRDFKPIIDYCADIGMDKIDTAECYGVDPPVEEMLGRALVGKRDKFIIATKFGHQVKDGHKSENFNLNFIEKQLENSLRNLRTDFIDIYYFHSGGNYEFYNDKLWEFLSRKVDSGTIGSLGLSLKHSLVLNKDYFQINKIKHYGITIVQTVLNMYSNQSLEHVIPFCKKNGISILGRMPFAKGLLTGCYNASHDFKSSDQRSNSPLLNKKIINNFPDITPKDAINWCNSCVDGIVVGSKNKKQIQENYYLINNS